jgi:hypothetical protein
MVFLFLGRLYGVVQQELVQRSNRAGRTVRNADKTDLGFFIFADAASLCTSGGFLAALPPRSRKRSLLAGFERLIRTAHSLHGAWTRKTRDKPSEWFLGLDYRYVRLLSLLNIRAALTCGKDGTPPFPHHPRSGRATQFGIGHEPRGSAGEMRNRTVATRD